MSNNERSENYKYVFELGLEILSKESFDWTNFSGSDYNDLVCDLKSELSIKERFDWLPMQDQACVAIEIVNKFIEENAPEVFLVLDLAAMCLEDNDLTL